MFPTMLNDCVAKCAGAEGEELGAVQRAGEVTNATHGAWLGMRARGGKIRV